MLKPSPAAGNMCPVRPQRQAVPGRQHHPGITGLVLTGIPGNADADISRVYVFAVREIWSAI